MSFAERTASAERITEMLERYLWAQATIVRHGIRHGRLGYELRLARAVMDALQSVSTPTAHLVRFFPDAVLAMVRGRAVLLEYKITRTPRYSLREDQWSTGQIEAAAWDAYLR